MTLQYLFEWIKNFLPNTSRPPLHVSLIVTFGTMSIVLSECFLAFFIFSMFYDEWNYTFSSAALLSAGVFFLQFLLAWWCAHHCLRKIYYNHLITKEYHTFKNTVAAFISGFKSR